MPQAIVYIYIYIYIYITGDTYLIPVQRLNGAMLSARTDGRPRPKCVHATRLLLCRGRFEGPIGIVANCESCTWDPSHKNPSGRASSWAAT